MNLELYKFHAHIVSVQINYIYRVCRVCRLDLYVSQIQASVVSLDLISSSKACQMGKYYKQITCLIDSVRIVAWIF